MSPNFEDTFLKFQGLSTIETMSMFLKLFNVNTRTSRTIFRT